MGDRVANNPKGAVVNPEGLACVVDDVTFHDGKIPLGERHSQKDIEYLKRGDPSVWFGVISESVQLKGSFHDSFAHLGNGFPFEEAGDSELSLGGWQVDRDEAVNLLDVGSRLPACGGRYHPKEFKEGLDILPSGVGE
jgi:hypothetical protein